MSEVRAVRLRDENLRNLRMVVNQMIDRCGEDAKIRFIHDESGHLKLEATPKGPSDDQARDF